MDPLWVDGSSWRTLVPFTSSLSETFPMTSTRERHRAAAGHSEPVDPALFWRQPTQFSDLFLQCTIESSGFVEKDFTGELFIPDYLIAEGKVRPG
jgi:hypothetical protein